jgi:hypothetical protein
MEKHGFFITDWIFFFDKKRKESFNEIIKSPQNKFLKDEFKTWKLITVFLPLFTFLFVVFLNLITTEFSYGSIKYFNNGSLPIIAFGVITSGMPYLLEQLEAYPDYHMIRRRIMAIGLFFLFFSAVIYILQTLEIVSDKITFCINIIILFFSCFVFIAAQSIGYKMYLVQSKHIKDFSQDVQDNVKDLGKSTDDLD